MAIAHPLAQAWWSRWNENHGLFPPESSLKETACFESSQAATRVLFWVTVVVSPSLSQPFINTEGHPTHPHPSNQGEPGSTGVIAMS